MAKPVIGLRTTPGSSGDITASPGSAETVL